jgi:excisionase family DNA binding protein
MLIVTEERLLTVPEVAARLRASQITVRKWLRAGRLRGSRFGGTKLGWRIPESEVARLIASGRPRETASDG